MKLPLTSLLLLTSLLPATALAQSNDADEAEVIPRYDVEIVLFRNVKAPRSREFVLPVSSPARPEKVLDLSSRESIESAAESGYELLATDELRLLEVVTRLIDSTRYELLLHAAWRQPGLEREQVLPVWIRGGRIYGNEFISIDNQIEMIGNSARAKSGEEGEQQNFEFDEQTLEAQELQLLEMQTLAAHDGLYELEGKISIVLSRYLHTYVDLVLRRPRLTADPALENTPGEEWMAAHAADTRILNNHQLKEHRRMRSKNLHYIDSPEFGMLILITPYEVAEGFEEAPIEPEEENEAVVAE